MKSRGIIISCSLTALVALLPAVSHASDKKDRVEVNPLITFGEQLEELNEECEGKTLDRDCEDRRQEIMENFKKLREICRKNADDNRCEALTMHHQSSISTIEAYCRTHPHESRCVRRLEHSKQVTKRLAIICTKNPDAKRCQVKVEKPKGAAAMEEYCSVFPEKRKCVNFKERQARNKPKEDGGSNEF